VETDVSECVAVNPEVTKSRGVASGGIARDWLCVRDVVRGIAGDRAARVS
jgi:hypothetical protein